MSKEAMYTVLFVIVALAVWKLLGLDSKVPTIV